MSTNCATSCLSRSFDVATWSGAFSPGRGWYHFGRTAIEYLLAGLLFVATGPFVLLAALLVRLTSPGPAIYRQVRVGLGGRPFTILKLRSMYLNSESKTGACWAAARDSRVTPVGRFLRFTHIDELPQLINVLRGEMSLIGPRPERPEIIPRLEEQLPRYCERLRVRPGMSGLAQVQSSAEFHIESTRRKLAYDLYYIEAVGPWLDLRILFGTALKVFGAPFGLIRVLTLMPSFAEVEGACPVGERTAAPAVQPV